MSWTFTGTNLHCMRHDTEFPVGRSCIGCATDPVRIETPGEAPPAVAMDENWFRDKGEQLITHAERYLAAKGKTRDTKVMIAARLADVALKYRRAASELARHREQWANMQRAEELARLALRPRH